MTDVLQTGMMIVDARWTSRVNMLIVRCDCGNKWEHRADRWRVSCPQCGRSERLDMVRERWVH